ncbi:MAG TPA: RHS repeat-associated core domain-containing protein [Terriglobia bacterium]|nr:RHS repeat-associated core domain-containing protein [Terriglobia bacterium]
MPARGPHGCGKTPYCCPLAPGVKRDTSRQSSNPELGNSSNLSADYSLTYSYAGNSNPPCTIPQGAGDNGSITGETYTDHVNSGYSHTFTYCYDAVNRLTHAVASGSPAYDLMYSYDQYGNGTCVPGSGGGLCPAMSYNSSTNRLTSIGSTAVSYDAAGNQLNDIWSTYEYDAEGRVKHSYSTGQWQYPTYNALGQRVQDYQGTDPMTLTYPIDLFGQRTGTFAQWPSQGWVGWNVYWSQIAGQRLNMGGASAYIDHSDAVGSTTMETDPAGGVQWDVTHYPWGGVFQEQGVRQSEVVMGLDWQVNDPLVPSATRELSAALGRWMTPDALGGDVTNPQSLNRYAYVTNNPTTMTDPLGLYQSSIPQGCHKELDGWYGEGTWKIVCDQDSLGSLPGGQQTSGGDPPARSSSPPDISKTWSRTFPCAESATQLMSDVQNDFGAFASNPLGPFIAKFPDQPLRMGNSYDIYAGLFMFNDAGPVYLNDLRVKVTAQIPNAWVFTTDPAHHVFDGTIAFIASSAGHGQVSFSITASANFTSWLNKYILGSTIRAGEESTWTNLLDKVQTHCSAGGAE